MKYYHFIGNMAWTLLWAGVLMIIRGLMRKGRTGQILRPGNSGQSYVSEGFFMQFCNRANSLLNKRPRKPAPLLSFQRPAKPRPICVSRGRYLVDMMILIIIDLRHYFLNVGEVNTGQRFRGIGEALSMPGFPLSACNLAI